MYPVACHGVNDTVDERVDHDHQIKQAEADSVYEEIDDQRHLSYTEVAEFLCEIQSKEFLILFIIFKY